METTLHLKYNENGNHIFFNTEHTERCFGKVPGHKVCPMMTLRDDVKKDLAMHVAMKLVIKNILKQ